MTVPERPYPCPYCSKGFRTAASLRGHIRREHPEVQDQPFGQLARTGPPARRQPMRRCGPIRPSTTGGRTDPERELIRSAVFERDHQTCRLRWSPLGPFSRYGPCLGKLTPHHLRKAGVGGSYTMHNLLTLCVGHNDAVEFLPRDDMVATGLVIPAWCLDHGRAWALLQLHGLVDWWWDGTPAHRERPDALKDVLP